MEELAMAKEIVFMQSVNNESIKWLIEQCQSDQEIVILLNSTGGETGAALAFYNFVRFKKIHLTVNVLSTCMSAAVIILCAGQKRIAAKQSRLLIHELTKGFNDGINEKVLAGILEDTKRQNATVINVLTNVTKKPRSKINSLYRQESLLTAQEAWELGLLTKKPY